MALPKTMRAARFTSTAGGLVKHLKVDAATPLPKNADSLPQDSTLVKVAYASLNPVDYKLPELYLFRAFKMSMPAVAGGDYGGSVVSTELPHLKPGDRVFGRSDPPAFGSFAEYLVVSNKEGVVPLPDGVSMRDAATLGVAGITAYQCLAPYVKPGSKVLINGGSGGTGSFGVQIAKAMGCYVTSTCSGPNVQMVKDLGADEVIDYRTVNVVEHLKRQGKQFDHIIDNVCTPDIYYNAHHYLKQGGIYALIAGEPSLRAVVTLLKMFCTPAWLGGGKRPLKFVERKSNAEDYATVAGWMKEGKVKAVVEKEYPLDEAADAFARLKTGRTRGKLVVKTNNSCAPGFNWTADDSYNAQSLCAYETVALGYSGFCGLFTYEDWEGYEYSVDINFAGNNAFQSTTGRAVGVGYVEEVKARLEHHLIKTPTAQVNTTLDSNEKTFPLHQALNFDFSHDTNIMGILTAFGLTQFAEALPDDHIKRDRQLIVSHMEPFGARLDIEIIETPSPLSGDRSNRATYMDGESTKYVHFILNQRKIPLGASYSSCGDRDDGWCEL
ncbi:uncharacterized protein LTR77_001263 [Saxophila tyrrhenica]|uniref:3-phytase n=1 Tax=Saxophila tyrrhenica TaxID=1690608 RepID=A0AAV9PJM2_9PEZI|nr:hypothetical protein LTR77_001263 [Saxophila tyrrhenica]